MSLHFMRMVFVCLLMALLQTSVEAKQADSDNPIVFHETGSPLHLNGVAPDVRLYIDYVWRKMSPEAARERLVLARGGRKQIVWNLNQLRGRVRIATKTDALRFVRLRTTPKTFYFFPPEEVEIIAHRDLARMPYYGVSPSRNFPTIPSGSLGVLSDREYCLSRFTPPRVRQIAEGFVIDRWTYANEVGICYVQEFVGKDGAYVRRVLKKRHVTRSMFLPVPEANAEE